ncbi:ADP-ribosylglycohydrolase family protein [Pseudodesulfovibrio sediminis]|uniref:ADP-ribosylglycohydrolase n=1 Tax=Pseudodesulfovibrio sediminis TaxID=2810563 RepID=A0ABN6EP44_9BACT|nr:ADP-ribosylglycohydrolase family protein [Pseudodesulfovibrio sediminis]BCS88163.1 ADP-ribosylglycohydrolase [Pseudodesulfovibrio sediminis]
MDKNIMDRAAGAIMGAWIGDALGVGPHWYYDLNELRQDYGGWVNDYTDPKPGRYHEGLKAGQLSQSGIILRLMVRSLVDSGSYDEADFCRRMDTELFPLLNGEPASGPGGYTSQSIRAAWRKRVEQKLPWGEIAGHADTTEAIERTLAIGVRYALTPNLLANAVSSNAVLTQFDDVVLSMTVAYSSVLAMLIQGNSLEPDISEKLMNLVKDGTLPFHAVTREGLKPPQPGDPDPPRAGRFASPDALLSPGNMAMAATDPDIKIEPAWKVSLVYGMSCAIYHMLPAAYYLSSRFKNDFESAVLHAINGGGQNQGRAILTGTLVGAQVGLSGIPARFLEKLEGGEELRGLAIKLAEQAQLKSD